jgi:type IV pilus assembly protein PilN
MSLELELSRGVDLLRERRLELGIAEPEQVQRQHRRQLYQGLVGAGAIVAGVSLLGLVVSLRHQFVLVSLDRVAVVEAKLAALQQDLDRSRLKGSQVKAENRALADGVVGTRSGSALLRQLQLLVPQGVQLLELKNPDGGDSLTLVGVAREPQAFARVNALELQLQQSPLLQADQVKLLKASRRASDDPNPELAGTVGFELSARLSKALPAAQEAVILRQLGADGIVRRLQLLERENLLQ